MDIYQLTSNTECQDFVVSSLLTRLPDGTFGPGIAESYTVSDDGKTYTFKLRDHTWSDGTPLTSEDVKFTWEYCTHPEGGCAQGAKQLLVEHRAAVDEQKLRNT